MKNIFAKDSGKPVQTVQSHITAYYLDISQPEQAEKYQEIVSYNKAMGLHLLEMIDGAKGGFIEDSDIQLETSCLFDNQWNTTDGRRVFDWYESIVPNRSIKRGHFLKQTSEMSVIRGLTFKCGYCNHEYYGERNGGKFCKACLDNPHLKPKDLHLLRVVPVTLNIKRRPLTQDEKDSLMPAYVIAQTTGKTPRAAKQWRKKKASLIADARKDIQNARMKRDGFLWLHKHGINIENVIFYNHKSTFSFGWQSPIPNEVKPELESLLQSFPYPWEYSKSR